MTITRGAPPERVEMSKIAAGKQEILGAVEFSIEPFENGPGVWNSSGCDRVIYILEGTACVRIGETWTEISSGSFVLVPVGLESEVCNSSSSASRILSCELPNTLSISISEILELISRPVASPN